MVIAVCIIIFVLSDLFEALDKSRSYYDYKAEKRHKELMEKDSKKPKTRTITREIVDEKGRTVRETIVEEI